MESDAEIDLWHNINLHFLLILAAIESILDADLWSKIDITYM